MVLGPFTLVAWSFHISGLWIILFSADLTSLFMPNCLLTGSEESYLVASGELMGVMFMYAASMKTYLLQVSFGGVLPCFCVTS